MKKQITRVSVAQTSKVAAALYFVITLPFVLLALLFLMAVPSASGMGMGKGMLIAVPFLYALGGFIFTAISALLYNLVASMVGGFEFTTSEVA